MDRAVRYGAMRLQQIGRNRVMRSRQTGAQSNFDIKGMKYADLGENRYSVWCWV